MSEWWRGGVIYQIYPRSFQDTNGDGIGDLPGIMDRLEHVSDLGADAVWLSPVFTSPMADMGYDVANYKDIDPLFGTLADFDQIVEKAHGLGLKVMIDQVLSHTSDQHPWFKESSASKSNSRADWYVWSDPRDDAAPPNNWTSVFGGSAWEWSPTRRQYYLHNFLQEQPDLNFHNPDVQKAVLDVLRFWLERGVDGFRFDTVNFYFHDKKLRNDLPYKPKGKPWPAVNPYDMQDHVYSKNRPENLDFLKKIRTLMNEYDDTTTVGEVGETVRPIEVMAAYTEGDERLHMAYSFEFLSEPFTAEHFRSRLEKFNKGAPHGWPAWSFSNHDVRRHVTRWHEHAKNPDDLAKQAVALLLSLRGSVCLYQGEEMGLPEADILFEELTDPPGIRFWPEYKGRDGCRTPMPWDEGDAPNGFTTGKPWLPVKASHSARNVAAQEADPQSVLNYYKTILKARRDLPALITGDIEFHKTDEPVLAFTRSQEEQTLACVFNLSPEPVSVKVNKTAKLDLLDVSRGAKLEEGKLELDANGAAWMKVDLKAKPPRFKYKAD